MMRSDPGSAGASTAGYRLWPHLLAVAALAIGVGMLFLREPGFGDDLDYWSLAFRLHEQGLSAWSAQRFHDLRWPVWGVSWLIQALAGPGLLSFHGVPIFYLALGAMAAFVLGRRLTASAPVGWGCALAFLFHPLLDSVCFRPMPDLSEGVWGAVVILGWWATMESGNRQSLLGWSALTGLGLVVLESNRITGAFILPVLLVATLALYRGRFGRLLLIGLFAVLGYAALAGLYRAHTGDWWHDLHANLRNKDAKGIASTSLWMAPFRFLDSLWEGGPLAPAYCLLAALGVWGAWRHCGRGGRLVVLWAGVLLLTYSCAPQRLWPYKPMLRDADRFLAGLAIPLSVLAVLGLGALFRPILSRQWQWASAIARRPALVGGVFLILLLGTTEREFRDLRMVREVRQHLAAKPDGLRVLSHSAMRNYTFLVAGQEARRMHWITSDNLLVRTAHIERETPASEELWYARQLMWVPVRSQLERRQLSAQPTRPGVFDALHQDWRLDRVIVKGNLPDLVFFTRRQPTDPPPLALHADDRAWQGLVPALPATWQRGQRRKPNVSWPIPPEWRGRMMHCELQASSPQVEPCEVRLVFRSSAMPTERSEYRLKPYLFPEPARDFFAFDIPGTADRCEITLLFEDDAAAVHFASFRAWLEPTRHAAD